nr:MAG TPA: hypothetical protein [Caudoviricetes sp.]
MIKPHIRYRNPSPLYGDLKKAKIDTSFCPCFFAGFGISRYARFRLQEAGRAHDKFTPCGRQLIC